MDECHTDAALRMARPSQSGAAPALAAVKRFAFIVPSAPPAIRIFGPLFGAITGLGHKVLCLTPNGLGGDGTRLLGPDIETGVYDPKPEGLSFLIERRAVERLSATLKDWRTHTVIGNAAAPSLLASRAAEAAGIQSRIAICSSRFDGCPNSERDVWQQAFATSTAAVFFSEDDRKAARKSGALLASHTAAVVPGAGIDLAECGTLPLPSDADGIVFLMHGPSPLALRELGAAAIRATQSNVNVRIVIASTARQADLSAIAAERVTPVHVSGSDVLTHTGDLRALLASCHVYVHVPDNSAMPADILEALAAGRTVITTDVSGCRDTVDSIVNGCLAAPGDAKALADAMLMFANNKDLIASAARASRHKAERRFDRPSVSQAWLKVLGIAS